MNVLQRYNVTLCVLIVNGAKMLPVIFIPAWQNDLLCTLFLSVNYSSHLKRDTEVFSEKQMMNLNVMEFIKEEPEDSSDPVPCRVKDEETEQQIGSFSKQISNIWCLTIFILKDKNKWIIYTLCAKMDKITLHSNIVWLQSKNKNILKYKINSLN